MSIYESLLQLFGQKKNPNTTETVDLIEEAVFEQLERLGFQKFGRTLHRFVSEDISQVIHFQSGMNDKSGQLCVNVGIRVPECVERSFQSVRTPKKYFHEHECNLRSRLGIVSGKRETWFKLKNDPIKTADAIWQEIETVVLPAFDVLNSREAILAHRAEFPTFDTMNHDLTLLESALIYGHLGDMKKARELFDQFYQSEIEKCRDRKQNGKKIYLRKGETVRSGGQIITAKKAGYYTVAAAEDGEEYIQSLDKLAARLGLRD